MYVYPPPRFVRTAFLERRRSAVNFLPSSILTPFYFPSFLYPRPPRTHPPYLRSFVPLKGPEIRGWRRRPPPGLSRTS